MKIREEFRMETYHLHNHQHIIRNKSPVCVDNIEIFTYPKILLVSWTIVASTKVAVSSLLGEGFNDLLVRVILFRQDQDQIKERLSFNVGKCSGMLEIRHLETATYSCDLIVSNSHNESIIIKCSSKKEYINHNIIKNQLNWRRVVEMEEGETWVPMFSAYTDYEND
jgi:hypothetical protein